MSDQELKLKKAQLYLNAYNNFLDIDEQITKLTQLKSECHKILCEAAGLFLDLDEHEMNRILFAFNSIATDAKIVLDIKE